MMNRYFATGLAVLGLSLSVVPQTYAVTVTNTNDSGPGSLREAFANSASVIEFAPFFSTSPQIIFLESSLPSIQRSMSVLGPGADLLTVDGQFRINSNALITAYGSSPNILLQGFTLTGGFDPLSSGNVGGIFSRSSLTLNEFALDRNIGTGLFNQGGVLNVINSTISGNTDEGIFIQRGDSTILNSTIANNRMDGIVNQVGDLTIRNSTIAGNARLGLRSTIDFSSNPGTLRIESTILADNGSRDLSADEVTSVSNSLIESGSPVSNGVDGNIVGFDPLLGSLANNGGSTLTMLPQLGSLVIDAGSNPTGLLEDQRGFDRVIGGTIDIGAVESVPEPSSLAIVVIAGIFWGARRTRAYDGQ